MSRNGVPPGEIKAIETRYKGSRFRSLTEARWAVLFDALGIEWVYELEEYTLPDPFGPYLPDFYLVNLKTWLEVKPRREPAPARAGLTDPTFDEKKVALVLGATDANRGLIAYGPPDVEGLVVEVKRWKNGYRFAYLNNPSHAFFPSDVVKDSEWWHGLVRFWCAVQDAKSARFEFGEGGASR